MKPKCALVLGAVALTFTVLSSQILFAAQGNDETRRFELIKKDGIWYKFDLITGETTLVKFDDKEKASGKSNTEKAPEPETTTKVSAPPAPPVRPSNRPPVLADMDGPQGAEATPGVATPYVITDIMRRRSNVDIAAYGGQLGLSQALQVHGGTISGLIYIDNKGPRKLTALELTLYVPTASDKPEEHRFLLSYNSVGSVEEPPQPATTAGRNPTPAVVRVDLPAPAGLKGKFDIKVTYLKFAEE